MAFSSERIAPPSASSWLVCTLKHGGLLLVVWWKSILECGENTTMCLSDGEDSDGEILEDWQYCLAAAYV